MVPHCSTTTFATDLARTFAVAGAALALMLGAGCRGGTSRHPPVHLVQDMDFQPKYRAQEASEFEGWPDGMAMRTPLANTVSQRRGPHLPNGMVENVVVKDAQGNWVEESPEPPTIEMLRRGREMFDINCSPCHDRTATGRGTVAASWPVRPVPVPSFYEGDRTRLPLGRIVSAITNGFNTMPSYAHQVRVEDRWAIAHYIRALQYRTVEK